jgi:hypothetical protein
VRKLFSRSKELVKVVERLGVEGLITRVGSLLRVWRDRSVERATSKSEALCWGKASRDTDTQGTYRLRWIN